MIGQSWEVEPRLILAARKGSREATASLLARFYPQVYRMSVNLAGSRRVGEDVVRRVMTRATVAMHGWGQPLDPVRWFRHHTLLATRAAVGDAHPAGRDVLLPGNVLDPAYAGFVKALRSRPYQQREALLLHHGEDFDLRNLGVAMDCSVEAAGVHLRSCTEALRQLAGDNYNACLVQMRDAYAAGAPQQGMALTYTRRIAAGSAARRVAAVLLWLSTAVVLAAGGLAAWVLWGRVVW